MVVALVSVLYGVPHESFCQRNGMTWVTTSVPPNVNALPMYSITISFRVPHRDFTLLVELSRVMPIRCVKRTNATLHAVSIK